MPRPVAALLVGLLLCAGGLTSACARGTSTPGPPPDDVAAAVCGTLVDWVGEIAAATSDLNDEVQAVAHEGEVAPDELDSEFLRWIDAVEAATDALVDGVGDLRFPPTERGAELAEDLAESADAARAEVDDLREQVEQLLGSEETLGSRMRTILVKAEKVMALAEPDVDGGDDADPLDRALLSEPACEHVTEP